MISEPQKNNFNFVFLGQSVLKYQVPLDIYNTINHIYETKYPELKPANKQLVGKIEKEHSLFYNGEDTSKMTKHNHLPNDVMQWFESKFKHYLEWNKVREYNMHFNSIWINTMFQHEYNPVHVHQGSLYTGLSSVMILKLPESFGVEYSAAENPMNDAMAKNSNALTYDELRLRLPPEVSDDVVKLLAASDEALLEFSNISTQQDVNEFNVKYGVELVLPQV